MLHPDIEKAIRLIDAKIGELKRAKQTLLEAFGEGKKINLSSSISAKTQTSHADLKKTTRKDELINLLKEEGPLSRSDIIEKTGLPKGTVAFNLNDKNTFVLKENVWHLKEQNSEGEAVIP